MVDQQLGDLLIEALETERGEIQIYETALRCVEHDALRTEWQQHSELTSRRASMVEQVVGAVGLDAHAQTTASSVVHYLEATLVHAMEMALESAPSGVAELVALECVSFAEARDRLNFERLSDVRSPIDREAAETLKTLSTEVVGATTEQPPTLRRWSPSSAPIHPGTATMRAPAGRSFGVN